MSSSLRPQSISIRNVAYSQAVTERTVEGWCTVGRKGVRLASFSVGRHRFTTLSALTRFLAESFGTGSTEFTQLEFDFDAAERSAAARSLAIEGAESAPSGAEKTDYDAASYARSRGGRRAASLLAPRDVPTADFGLGHQDASPFVAGGCHV